MENEHEVMKKVFDEGFWKISMAKEQPEKKEETDEEQVVRKEI